MGLFNKSTDKKFDKIFDRYVKKLHSSVKGNNIENLCNNSEELAAELKKAGCLNIEIYVQKYFRERGTIISNWYEKATEKLEKKLGEEYFKTSEYHDLYDKFNNKKNDNDHFLSKANVSGTKVLGNFFKNRPSSTSFIDGPAAEKLHEMLNAKEREEKALKLLSDYATVIEEGAEKYELSLLKTALELREKFEDQLASINGLTIKEKELYLRMYDDYYVRRNEEVKEEKVQKLFSEYENIIIEQFMDKENESSMFILFERVKEKFKDQLASIDGLTSEEKENYFNNYRYHFPSFEHDYAFENIKNVVEKNMSSSDKIGKAIISEYRKFALKSLLGTNLHDSVCDYVDSLDGLSDKEKKAIKLEVDNIYSDLFLSAVTDNIAKFNDNIAKTEQLSEMLEENKKSENSTTKEVNGKFSK